VHFKVERVAHVEHDHAVQVIGGDVPGEDAARARHQVAEHGVGSDDVVHARLGELLQHGVLLRRLEEEGLVGEALELLGHARLDAVVVLVVGLEDARPLEVLARHGHGAHELLELRV
jgi:hypothetical protein